MSRQPTSSASFPVIQKDVELSSLNTLGVDAKAAYFVNIDTPGQLQYLYHQKFFVRKSPFILGGGSNILLRNNPKRTVLKVSLKGIQVIRETDNYVWIQAAAGENWHDLVTWAVDRNYGGIENLALIPGTVGAAPIQNIGAYGVELEQVFDRLSAFQITNGEQKNYSKEECQFDYRDSIFKRKLRGKVIITDLTLQLTKRNHQLVNSYYALQEYFSDKSIEHPGIRDIYDAVITIRRAKLPDPGLIGNAGSFFKNPIVNPGTLARLQESYPDIPSFPVDDNRIKIPAGWLIEQAGWKGKKVGNVGTYENQALVIVNFGNATGDEIYAHAQKIQDSVRNKFGIELTPEVNIVE